MRLHRLAPLALACLAACTVGPDYVRPDVATTPAYEEAPADPGWKPAQPAVADADHVWWAAFDDATLDGLLTRADAANQTIAQAEANVRAARAAVAAAQANFFPVVGASAGVERARTNTTRIATGNSHTATLSASWEPDLWGGVRRQVESAGDSRDAAAATAAGVRLTVAADVAQDYYALRNTDLLIALYDRTVDAYEKALALTKREVGAGTATGTDVALATSSLESARAQRKDLVATRAQYEHAIATLVGDPPARFKLDAVAPDATPKTLPTIPAGLPSTLLERRPDIANAERLAAAANANIGVAKAAYFPSLTLAAIGGDSLAGLGPWFTAPGRVWSLGATLAGVLFDGGYRRAQTDAAIARYDAAVATYRQTVLAGFQDVEDNLALVRVLADEQTSQDAATVAARDAERIALAQYRAGTTDYLTVLTAQNQALASERASVTLRGRRFVASVALIRALGGGWSTDRLADAR